MNLRKLLSLLIEMGGPGSGNFGHAGGEGGKGNRGGSQPTKGLKTGGTGAVMSYGENGRTARKRQLAASLRMSTAKLDEALELYKNKQYTPIIDMMSGMSESKMKKFQDYLREESKIEHKKPVDVKLVVNDKKESDDSVIQVKDSRYEPVTGDDVTSTFTPRELDVLNTIMEKTVTGVGLPDHTGKSEKGEYSVPYIHSQPIVDKANAAIAKRAGVTKNEANSLVMQWAGTSNDNTMESLSIQEAASELFDVPLSDWQKKRIEEVGKEVEAKKMRIEDTYPMLSYEKALDKYYNHDQSQIDFVNSTFRGIYDKESNPVLTGKVGTSSSAREKEKRVLRAMYEETQSFLDETLPDDDYITLYRGIGRHRTAGVGVGEQARLESNVLESWTLHPIIADGFGDMVKARIPKKRILSLFSTGSGTTYEREVVVIGNGTEDLVTVVKK